MQKWRFPGNGDGQENGFEDSASFFRGDFLTSLAREICQNSLDAAFSHDLPVKIVFEQLDVPVEEIPGYQDLRDSLLRCLDYVKDKHGTKEKKFFGEAISRITSEAKLPILRISDFNTTGLTGSDGRKNTNWYNLIKASGSSDKSETSGGSYGIGKNAAFACSLLRTVIYSTHDCEGRNAYEGVSRLISFQDVDGYITTGIGYYGEERNTPIESQFVFPSSGLSGRSGDEYGTDIYILGFASDITDYDNKGDMIASVIDNFLWAIWKGTLEVTVSGENITKDTLPSCFEKYHDSFAGDKKNAQYYYKAICSPTKETTEEIASLGTLRLFLLANDPEAPRSVVRFRENGMKIFESTIKKGFSIACGVLIAEGQTLNSWLLKFEGPEHKKWERDRAENKEMYTSIMRKMKNFISETIDEICNAGETDTTDAEGVGLYLPDIPSGDEGKEKTRVISDNIDDIKVHNTKKIRTISDRENKKHEVKDGDIELVGNFDDGGGFTPDSEGNSGPLGNHTGKSGRHFENPAGDQSENPGNKSISISEINIPKVRTIMLRDGEYIVELYPDSDSDDGRLEVFIAGETIDQKADILEAYQMPNLTEPLKVDNGNIITGIKFSKGKSLRLKIRLQDDFICSLKVIAYATK